MAADPRARELLELMSRTVEAHPGADARTLRVRAGVKRAAGDKALELLERAGYIECKQVAAQDSYRSLKPYRASVEAPRTAFAKTYSVRQGGT
jgi:propanediol dehydratase small subunit